MKITKLNYELYAIDYLEGNLSKDLKVLFDQYLDKHPEVREELSDYLEAPFLDEDSSVLYQHKENLRQPSRSKWLWATALLMLIVGAGFLSYNYYSTTVKRNEPLPPMQEKVRTVETPALAIESVKTQNQTEIILKKATPDTKRISQVVSNNKKKAINKNEKKQIATKKVMTEKLLVAIVPLSNAIAESQRPKPVPSKVESPSQEQQQAGIAKLEAVSIIEPLAVRSLASTNKSALVSDKKMTFMIDLATEQKNTRWWTILTPKAYNGLNIKDALASNSLRSSINELSKN